MGLEKCWDSHVEAISDPPCRLNWLVLQGQPIFFGDTAMNNKMFRCTCTPDHPDPCCKVHTLGIDQHLFPLGTASGHPCRA